MQRVLAALLLMAALAAVWIESKSTLATSVRENRPWLAWLEARERGGTSAPSLHLLIYDPVPRRLVLLHVPNTLKIDKKMTLERAYFEALKATASLEPAAAAAENLAEARLRELSPETFPTVSTRLALEIPPIEEGDEPVVAVAVELKSRARRPRSWVSLLRRGWRALIAGDPAAADPVLFALEMRRIPFENFSLARLPDNDNAPALLSRLMSTEIVSEDIRATTVEVLNGTPESGLASRAAKMLRFKGADVLSTASTESRARTLIYDRVGDFHRAVAVRLALRCRSARAVTRIDPTRAVDVSVALGADCAEAFGPDVSRQQ